MKRLLTLLLFALAIVTNVFATIEEKKPSGSGTESSPYLIGSAEELYWLGQNKKESQCYAKLTADFSINCEEVGVWFTTFYGYLDGDGHTITYTEPNSKNQYSTYFIRDLYGVVTNLNITGYFHAPEMKSNYDMRGCIAYYVREGAIISNCNVSGTVTLEFGRKLDDGPWQYMSSAEFAGIAAWNEGTIMNCASSIVYVANRDGGSWTGWNNLAGIVISNRGTGFVTNCVFNGKISNLTNRNKNKSDCFGGIAASNYGTINNCECSKSAIIVGDNRVGGIVGFNYGGLVTNCKSQGSVQGYYNVGGIVGSLNGGSITKCEMYGEIGGSQCIGGIVGRIKATEKECTIDHCVSRMDYSSGSIAGGIVGAITDDTNPVKITMCENISEIRDSELSYDYLGGIIGSCIFTNTASRCQDCISNTIIEGRKYIGGLFGELITANAENVSSCLNYGTQVIATDACGPLWGNDVDKVYRGMAYGKNISVVKDQIQIDLTKTRQGQTAFAYTDADLTSGALTYHLQDNRTSALYWGQKLGTDTRPQMNYFGNVTNRVYTASDYQINCANQVTGDVQYTNNGSYHNFTTIGHQYDESGYCSVCHQRQPISVVNGVYQISNRANLMEFTELANKTNSISGIITKDIEACDSIYTITEFTGQINGQGHKVVFNQESEFITNLSGKILKINTEGLKCLAYKATNAELSDCSMKGNVYLVDYADNCTFMGCSVKGDAYMVRSVNNCIITGCHAETTKYLVEKSRSSSFSKCYVIGTPKYIIRESLGNTIIDNSYSYSSISTYISQERASLDEIHNSYLASTNGETCCYYNESGSKVSVKLSQVRSGELAVLLGNDVWKQDLSVEDSYPTFEGPTVYKKYTTNCINEPYEDEAHIYYTNNESEVRKAEGGGHVYEDYYCKLCQRITTHEDGKYHIASVSDLVSFRDIVNEEICVADAILDADIDLSSICNNQTAAGVWVPIGNSNETPYVGAFEGNNHTIKGYYYASISNTEAQQYGGLFGRVGTPKTGYQRKTSIKNLTVEGTLEVKAERNGMLAGLVTTYSTIDNCKAKGTITAQGDYTGGIVGILSNYSAIQNCTSEVSINSTYNNVGGIAGALWTKSTVAYSENKGDVQSTMTNGNTGGITGSLSIGQVLYCINSGTITGFNNVGGLCGNVANAGKVSSCYSIGNVSSASQYAHALIGSSGSVTQIDKLYYDKTVCSLTDSKGEGYTTVEFGYGAVAYLLGTPWGQEIGKDEYPVLNGPQVYKNTDVCTCYSNKEGDSAGHTYINGVCAICGDVLPLLTDADGCYLIKNYKNLQDFRDIVNGGNTTANARVVNNIDLSPICSSTLGSWIPIGTEWDNRYAGHFDGGNHTIKGMYIKENAGYKGLFGFTNGAEISNVSISGNMNVGGSSGMLVGCMMNGTITNCTATGRIVCGGQKIGGIVGDATGDISDCRSSVNISGTGQIVGGIAGWSCGNINRCENEERGVIVTTTTGNAYIGGIVGQFVGTSSEGVLENCRNLATLSAGSGSYAGGLVGYIYKYYTTGISPVVKSSYNTGEVLAKSYKAALVAKNDWTDASNVQNCYYRDGRDSFGEKLTAEDFRFGYAAYKLQGDWGQAIGYEELLPVLDGAKVYEHTQDIPDWATEDEVENNSNAEFKWSVTPSDGYAYVKLGFYWEVSCNESEDRLWLYAGDFEKGCSYEWEGQTESVSQLCGGKFRFAAVYARGNDDDSALNTVYLNDFDLKWYSNNESDIFEGDGMLPGDINADGNISIADIALMIEIINGNDSISKSNADMNKDGKVTLEDLNLLKDILLSK